MGNFRGETTSEDRVVDKKPNQPGSTTPDSDREEQLQSAFEDWDRAGKRIRLDAEPDFDEPEEPEDGTSTLVRARRAVKLRAAALVVIASVCALSLYSTRQEAAYFFADRTATELGNVRDLFAAGKTVADTGRHNTYVHVEGLVITRVAETDKYVYFLDPVSSIIVRTRRELPEKSRLMTVPIDDRLLPLVQERKLFPHDLTASFEAKGRLVRLDEAPGWARSIVQFYSNAIEVPYDKAYLLVDGESPGSTFWTIILYGVAVLLLSTSVAFLVRAVRRERDIAKALGLGR